MPDFEYLESQLLVVVSLIRDTDLPESTIEIIEDFAKNKEYGLAVEWLCDAARNRKIPMPKAAMDIVDEVGRLMNMDASTWENLETL